MLQVEGWIGDHEVGFQLGVLVIQQGVAHADIALQPVQDQVHLAQPDGGVDGFLAVEGQGSAILGKPGRLNEHPAAAARRVQDSAALRGHHRHQQLDYRTRREELATAGPLSGGKVRDEILVDAAQYIALFACFPSEDIASEKVDQPGDTRPWQVAARVNFGQHPTQFGVTHLEQFHGPVEFDFDVIIRGMRDQIIPAGFVWHDVDILALVLIFISKNILGDVFVFREILALGLFYEFLQLIPTAFIAQREKTQKDQRQDIVFVVRRGDAAAQSDGGFPEFRFEVDVGLGGVGEDGGLGICHYFVGTLNF